MSETTRKTWTLQGAKGLKVLAQWRESPNFIPAAFVTAQNWPSKAISLVNLIPKFHFLCASLKIGIPTRTKEYKVTVEFLFVQQLQDIYLVVINVFVVAIHFWLHSAQVWQAIKATNVSTIQIDSLLL